MGYMHSEILKALICWLFDMNQTHLKTLTCQQGFTMDKKEGGGKKKKDNFPS